MASLTTGENLAIFNSLSFARTGLVPLTESYMKGAITMEGEEVPVQLTEDGLIGLVTVPACGAVSLLPKTVERKNIVITRNTENGVIMENDIVRVLINHHGEVVSFVDRSTGREFAAGAMNRLLMYKDVPRIFDAWDIDSNYILQPVHLDEPVNISIRETGGLRAVVHISRKIQNSSFEQEIVLDAGSRRLDFVTTVDWKELHRLLKVTFPVNVLVEEGINEIQFGYLKRPTHRSRLYDIDRFEVCNQRYSALCDESHGAAVLVVLHSLRGENQTKSSNSMLLVPHGKRCRTRQNP